MTCGLRNRCRCICQTFGLQRGSEVKSSNQLYAILLSGESKLHASQANRRGLKTNAKPRQSNVKGVIRRMYWNTFFPTHDRDVKSVESE